MKILKKNKKGNIFLGVSVALFIWFFGILVLPFVMDDVTTLRTALSCSNPSSITGSTMINCLFADAVVPYLIWTFLSIALGYIAGRDT